MLYLDAFNSDTVAVTIAAATDNESTFTFAVPHYKRQLKHRLASSNSTLATLIRRLADRKFLIPLMVIPHYTAATIVT